MKPTVSIVIYYKEDRGWLKDALASVRNLRYGGKIDLIIKTGGTAAENLNAGIKDAKGKYLRYLSEDDILPPYSVHQHVLQFEKDGADFIHGNAINFWGHPVLYSDGCIGWSGRHERQVPRLEYPSLSDMLEKNVIHGGTVMYRTEILKENLFDESLTCAEEYELNMRLMKKGFNLDYCRGDLYFYRRHQKQKSMGVDAVQAERKEKIKAIQDKFR